MESRKWGGGLAALLAAVALAAPALADAPLTQTSAGIFSNAIETGASTALFCGGAGQPLCSSLGIPTAGAQVRWGGAASPNAKSGLAYEATPGAVTPGTSFVLGKLVHYNNVVAFGSTVTQVDLNVSAQVADGAGTIISGTIPVRIGVDETDNIPPCAYAPVVTPCPDKISIPTAGLTTSGDRPGIRYTLEVLGFKTDPAADAAPLSFFISQENTVNTGYLVARVVVDHAPIADAGPPQRVDATSNAGATLGLDGTASTDPDGDSLSYTWTGPFGTATGPQPTVVLPVGTSTVTLIVSDGTLTSTAASTVTVFAPITAAGTTVTRVEGAPFAGAAATFTDPDADATPGEYSASIDWGDGTSPSTGTITKAAGGTFTVSGTHTWTEEGTYTTIVTVTDTDNAFNAARARSSVTIADAGLAATGGDLVSQQSFSGGVATFTDANANAPVTDFTAMIDWGDGSAPSAGVISGTGPFTVTGTHSYAALGHFAISVHIVDDGGSTADAKTPVLIFAVPAGGAFVIGDGNASLGTAVTFWGSQWWKLNTLTAGAAPAAFKGFETSAAAPQCQVPWTTDPGNSPPPPSGPLPSYMAVIVASAVTQTGSTIGGDVRHVVVVQTNPGYSNDPGHAGTGVVVGTVC